MKAEEEAGAAMTAELATLSSCDPIVLKQKEADTKVRYSFLHYAGDVTYVSVIFSELLYLEPVDQIALESANRWTDNAFSVEKWCFPCYSKAVFYPNGVYRFMAPAS